MTTNNQYLITLTIGPVQDFIAAARRTRDLWSGSFLLSEISKAAAKSFADQQGELIFPAPNDIEADLKPINKYEEDVYNVGNKVLAIISTNNPAAALETAKQAARNRWEYIAEAGKNKAEKVINLQINQDRWDKQSGDILELYGAWKKLEDNQYVSNRSRLDQLLNARKNTREFIQNPITEHYIPKSSLDGLREKVTESEKNLKPWQLLRAGVNRGEYLDCSGIVKRLWQEPEQFTPISRLAVQPWIEGLPEGAITQGILDCFDKLAKTGLCSRVSGNQATYRAFPYDGQLLFPFRRDAELSKLENKKDPQDSETQKTIDLLKQLNKEIDHSGLHKKYGEPSPYMVILAADGDRMGVLLDTLKDKQQHKNISNILTSFATEVPTILRKYQGHCIYAGGDDVLALLPLHTAIDCSHDLAKQFRETMEKVEGIETVDTPPTLSVGLGISHFMNPMSKQLQLARQAEKLAKGNNLSPEQQKNSLALIMQPRSGSPISFREKWNEDAEDKSAQTILNNWVHAHLKQLIPTRAAYNLRETAQAFDWTGSEHSDFLQQETERIMERKRDKDGDKLESKWINMVCDRVGEKGLSATANELILTRRIAQASKLASGTAQSTEGTNND